MKPESTDAQRKRRRGAVISTVVATVWLAVMALVMLWLREPLEAEDVLARVLLILAVIELAAIIPVWVNLRTRLKEIKGGEEDAAAQY